MCIRDRLNTVSLLKSEFTKDRINPMKLITTNKNCKNVKITIFLSRLSEFLKFLIEKKIIKKEIINPKFNE